MWGLDDPSAVGGANPRLTLLESTSAVDGCERIPRPLLRAYTRFMGCFSFYRNMIRPLRVRIEPHCPRPIGPVPATSPPDRWETSALGGIASSPRSRSSTTPT